MNLKVLLCCCMAMFCGCAGNSYQKTVEHVAIDRFMGIWYVITGRFTFLESGAHNAVEVYTWNQAKQRIDIDFRFNKDSLTGKEKKIPQTGRIVDNKTNARWKVSPFWPLSFDYLVIALDADYQWTAIGVPSQKYLWIMARTPSLPEVELDNILQQLRDSGYRTDSLVTVPHNQPS